MSGADPSKTPKYTEADLGLHRSHVSEARYEERYANNCVTSILCLPFHEANTCNTFKFTGILGLLENQNVFEN